MANSETIVLIGVNHKTAPLELREQLAFQEGYDPPLAALSCVRAAAAVLLLLEGVVLDGVQLHHRARRGLPRARVLAAAPGS